jgi:hypothetical protein
MASGVAVYFEYGVVGIGKTDIIGIPGAVDLATAVVARLSKS